jgi:hypothetical protein
MKSEDTIARLRREHFIRHRSIQEISRELNVSQNTVRKILRCGATEFQYEREVHPLPIASSSVKMVPLLLKMLVPLYAARPSIIPGIMCRFWPSNRGATVQSELAQWCARTVTNRLRSTNEKDCSCSPRKARSSASLLAAFLRRVGRRLRGKRTLSIYSYHYLY